MTAGPVLGPLYIIYRRAIGSYSGNILGFYSDITTDRTFSDAGRVHGVLLPLLGRGLILAGRPHAGLELQRWLLPVQDRIVVPEGNHDAAHELTHYGYPVVSTDLRMVHGPMPPFDPTLVYAWPW